MDDAQRRKVDPTGLWLLVPIGLGVVALVYGGYEIVERVWLLEVEMKTLHLLHAVRGTVASLVLGGTVAWYLLRRGIPVFPASQSMEMDVSRGGISREARLLQHTLWFIDLRWVAVGVLGAMVLLAHSVGHIIQEETFLPLILCIGLLAASNGFYVRCLSRTAPGLYRGIILQIFADLVILTALLHFSGGAENPLFILYSFHVIIACILLGRREGYLSTLAACGLFGMVVMGELFHILPHYTVRLFPHDLGTAHAAHDLPYALGRFLSFSGVLFGTAYFIGLIMDYLRQNEAYLEEMVRTAASERQKLEGVIHAVGAGMILFDRDLRIQWFNRQVEGWFGWTERQLGQPCYSERGKGPCEYDIRLADRALQTGEAQEVEWTFSADGGQKRFYRVTASPILDQDGEVVQVATLIQDVTARKAIEAQMLHSEKMALLGRMAAGIVHEIGNPLSSLSTRLRLLEGRRGEKFVAESVRLLHGQIDRIQRIVRGVSQFTRFPKEEWTSCRLEKIVSEMLEVLRMDRKTRGISIEVDLSANLPSAVGVQDRLAQVFLNIGLNALEAMEAGGRLRVRLTHRNGEIEASFSDTGSGMNRETQERIFDPFFSTKTGGSGLGMFISYSIVNAHGGRIEVASKEGEGTTVTVFLPARPDVAG